MARPSHHARRIGGRIALGLPLALLTGCQSFRSATSFARVRVIDLSPDTASIDLYNGSEVIASNLSYGAVTSYVSVATGYQALTLNLGGSKQMLASVKGSLNAGGLYTVLVINPAASLQPLLLTDAPPPQLVNEPVVRVIHQATHVGPVDVYLVPAGQRGARVGPALVTNLAPGAITGYLAVPSGLCTAVVVPTGVVPSATNLAAPRGAQMEYSGGSMRSLILVDPQPSVSPRLQVIATVDADPVE